MADSSNVYANGTTNDGSTVGDANGESFRHRYSDKTSSRTAKTAFTGTATTSTATKSGHSGGCARCGHTNHTTEQCKLRAEPCANCGRNNHTTQECYLHKNKGQCATCCRSGHTSQECWFRGGRKGCETCGRLNHETSEHREWEGGKRFLGCEKCGRFNHTTEEHHQYERGERFHGCEACGSANHATQEHSTHGSHSAKSRSAGMGSGCLNCGRSNHRTEECWFLNKRRGCDTCGRLNHETSEHREWEGGKKFPGCEKCGRFNHTTEEHREWEGGKRFSGCEGCGSRSHELHEHHMRGSRSEKSHSTGIGSGSERGATTTSGYGGGATTSGYGGGTVTSGYGGGTTASGYGGGTTASGYGGGTTTSGYGGGTTLSRYGGGTTTSGNGNGATASGYGRGATTSGYGGGTTTSGYGGKTAASGCGGGTTASGYGGGTTASGNGDGTESSRNEGNDKAISGSAGWGTQSERYLQSGLHSPAMLSPEIRLVAASQERGRKTDDSRGAEFRKVADNASIVPINGTKYSTSNMQYGKYVPGNVYEKRMAARKRHNLAHVRDHAQDRPTDFSYIHNGGRVSGITDLMMRARSANELSRAEKNCGEPRNGGPACQVRARDQTNSYQTASSIEGRQSTNGYNFMRDRTRSGSPAPSSKLVETRAMSSAFSKSRNPPSCAPKVRIRNQTSSCQTASSIEGQQSIDGYSSIRDRTHSGSPAPSGNLVETRAMPLAFSKSSDPPSCASDNAHTHADDRTCDQNCPQYRPPPSTHIPASSSVYSDADVQTSTQISHNAHSRAYSDPPSNAHDRENVSASSQTRNRLHDCEYNEATPASRRARPVEHNRVLSEPPGYAQNRERQRHFAHCHISDHQSPHFDQPYGGRADVGSHAPDCPHANIPHHGHVSHRHACNHARAHSHPPTYTHANMWDDADHHAPSCAHCYAHDHSSEHDCHQYDHWYHDDACFHERPRTYSPCHSHGHANTGGHCHPLGYAHSHPREHTCAHHCPPSCSHYQGHVCRYDACEDDCANNLHVHHMHTHIHYYARDDMRNH